MKKLLFCIALLLAFISLNAQTNPCLTPDTPTNLSFTQTSNAITGTFVKAIADAHIVIMTQGEALNLQPIKGTTYKVGDTLGNGIVKALPPGTMFSASNLKGSTTYNFYIFSYNRLCDEGPVYSTDPLSNSAVTKTGPPNLEIVSVDSNTLEIKATKSPNFVIVLRKNYILPTAAAIKGKMKVGDILADGSEVIYKGTDTNRLRISNLEANTPYFFTAYGLEDNDTVYSNTNNTQLRERTLTILPVKYLNDWNADAKGQNTALPAGFSRKIYDATNLIQNFYLRSPQSTPVPGIKNLFEIQYPLNSSTPMTGDLITPNILLGSGKHRLYFDYACLIYGSPFVSDYTFKENDSIFVQISSDGENFEDIFLITNQNQSLNKKNLARQVVVFDKYQNMPVKFRFVYSSCSKSALRLTAIKVESLPICDYPLEVRVPDSSIETHKIALYWNETNETAPIAWNISYYDTLQKQWSENQRTDKMPYSIEDLKSQTYYQVQVQAVCAESSLSPWSDPSALFITKYAVPFKNDFTDNVYWTNPIPTYWERKQGVFTDTADVVFTSTTMSQWDCVAWRGDAKNPSIFTYFGSRKREWLMTPVFDLKEAGANTKLEFDFALNANLQGKGGVDTVSLGARFLILISTDSGRTWNKDGILKGYGEGSPNLLSNLDSVHEILDLSAYTGKVQIGFYIYCDSSKPTPVIFIDNVEVNYTCQPITDLEVKDIKEDQVNLSWNSSQADTFLLRYKIKDAQDYQYVLSTTSSFVLKGLSAQTEYEYEVAGMCSTADTGKWIHIDFVTLAPYICDTVTNLKITSVERYAASLKWEGSAAAYNLRYRILEEENWHTVTVKTTEFYITSLEVGTEYEYSVQAQCSEDSTDLSLWTSSQTFMTLQITCTTPTDIQVLSTTYQSVTIAWVSDADKCELQLRSKGLEVWDKFEWLFDTITVKGLNPNKTYEFRVRALCNAIDNSEWSDIYTAKTLVVPECAAPTNLRTSAITETSALLQWDSLAMHTYWNVSYKKASGNKMDTVLYLPKAQLQLDGLQKNTAYTWSVQALCDEYLSSDWASPFAKFTTQGVSNMQIVDIKENFSVSAKHGQISILNPQSLFVERAEIISIQGAVLNMYPLQTNENILIPTSIDQSIVILRLYTKGQYINYKLYLK